MIVLGAAAFGAGVSWWALAITVQPNYVSGVLGGMILTGVGVGLTLPTLMATATSSLPSHSFATGSAVINMIRQTGLALGVAVLVAVLGTHTGRAPRHPRSVPPRLVGLRRHRLRRDHSGLLALEAPRSGYGYGNGNDLTPAARADPNP